MLGFENYERMLWRMICELDKNRLWDDRSRLISDQKIEAHLYSEARLSA